MSAEPSSTTLVGSPVLRQGGGMHFAGELTPEQFWAVVDEVDQQIRRTFAERPVYAVRGWRGRTILLEWSYGAGTGIRALVFLSAEGDGVNSDDDATPRVSVLTDIAEPRRVVAERVAMEAFTSTHEPPRLHDEAPTPDSIVELMVDGAAEPFELWSGGAVVRAAGRVGGVSVVIEAVGYPIDEIELERLPRIDDVLAERRRWIRAQRGGI